MAEPPLAAPATCRTFHVAGIVVHARPAALATVASAIAALPGAEVHGTDPRGRIAVAVGAESAAGVADVHLAIAALSGVMAASLVYEHHEEIDA